MGTELVASQDESDALLRILALIEPEVVRLREAHEESYGQLLVTVLLGDLARWLFEENPATRLPEAVNDLLLAGSPAVRNVLLTGFVEGVPVGIDPELVDDLGEPLRSEVRRDLGIE